MALAHNALILATYQSIFLGLAWIFVCIRLYIRKVMVRSVAMDDHFLIFTLFLYTVFAAVISVVGSVYVFNHAVSLEVYVESLNQVSRGVHYFYLAEIFYILTAAFLRITVGLLLLRIAHTRGQKWTIYVSMLFMILISTAFLLVVIFQCSPVKWYWNYNPADVLKGHCYNRRIITDTAYVHAAISCVSDMVLGFLPLWLLWSVQISRSKKVGIAFLLGLGVLCGVAAIVRVVYIGELDAKNFEANWIGLAICSIIEPGLGLIGASVAAFQPIFATNWFRHFIGKLSIRKTILFKRDSVNGKSKERTVTASINAGVSALPRTDDDINPVEGADIEKGIMVQTDVVRTVEYIPVRSWAFAI